ncbi:MAG: aspartate/glutamate racemase family protein [Chloroflexi bacterium]|nr:aspartate/glutamate racemase family protein [Chloroflexota bacterium]
MVRICVINPNSTAAMTDHLRHDLEQIKRPDTQLLVINPEYGPVSVESMYDETLAGAQVLPLVQKANEEGYDAIILACFSDPGLDAAKEISDVPVFGIEETSLHVAAMLGHKFAITVGYPRRAPIRQWHARLRGVGDAYASCLVMNMSVLDMHAKPTEAKARILELARRAVQEEGVEVIVLGCAGLSGYAENLERELGVTVVDPSAVTLKVAEALTELGLRHSKVARFAKPPAKEIK